MIKANQQGVSLNKFIGNALEHAMISDGRSKIELHMHMDRIINENNIKSNPDYSIYNFRNKKQEEQYGKDGIVPNGVPSIYKESTIDFIIKIYQNEH